MKSSFVSSTRLTPRAQAGERASTRLIIVVPICLALGFAGGAFWYYRATQSRPTDASQMAGVDLSAGAKAVLQRLEAPLEIRFYAALGEQSTSDSLRAFVGRADQLLTAFEQAAQGKIRVTRVTTLTDAQGKAAADGIPPLTFDHDDPCYLGLVVIQADQKEALPRLSPEWEAALEADLARAITRVSNARRLAARVEATTAADAAAAETVQRALPNLASLSAKEGEQALRDAALEEFKSAATAMQKQIEAVQERLRQALNGGSEADQQAAMKELQQLQTEQTQKLKNIGIQLRTQIGALERLKGVPPQSDAAKTNSPGARPKR